MKLRMCFAHVHLCCTNCKTFCAKNGFVCIYSSLILNWASSAKKLYVEVCSQNFNKWLLALMCDISQLASTCLSICPSISVEQLGSHCTDFQEIQHLHIFRKSFEKIQVLLKSDKNTVYLTWRPVYIYDSTLLHCSLEMFQTKFVYKLKQTFYV